MPEALVRAIARLRSRYEPVEALGRPYLTEHQAELIDRGDVEALRVATEELLQIDDYMGEEFAKTQAYNQARRMVVEMTQRSGRALAVIESVVRGLAPLTGRKVVVLASDGFLIGLGRARDERLRRATDHRRRHALGSGAVRARHAGPRRRAAGRRRLVPRPRGAPRARRAGEPADAQRRGDAPGHERPGRRHRRLPGQEQQRPRPGAGPHPARQRDLLPAGLRADQHRARRAFPQDPGAAARPARAQAADAQRLLRARRAQGGGAPARTPTRRPAASARSPRRSARCSRCRTCRCGSRPTSSRCRRRARRRC